MDIERFDELLDWLRAHGRIGAQERPRMAVLAGGVSNRTVLLERQSGEAWVLKQALEKLRVQADWFSDPARILREALGLRELAKLAPTGTITPLIFEDEPVHVLAMAAVPKPHENWKTMLLAGNIEVAHVRQFAELLGTVHRRSHEARAELAAKFEDRRFFESLRLEPYYAYSAERVPDAARFLNALIEATRARRLALVHGDYSPKNVLVHAGRLVLLDHEVIHWGDPAFDLGFALTHLLSKAHHLPARRAAFAAAAGVFWKDYAAALGDVPWGAVLERFVVRHALGCLLARVAGRSPLEYLTSDERKRQQEAAIELMGKTPERVQELVETFTLRLA
ncbi:MAG: phosphotransferase [Planctomycetota bacterium]|nr:phosphotransferase [Planctomycetota bacterium]